MKKLTKTQVIALIKKLNAGQKVKVSLLPSKTSYSGYKCWIQPYEIETDNITDFTKTINEFSYYNCNSEVGNTVHYYIKE